MYFTYKSGLYRLIVRFILKVDLIIVDINWLLEKTPTLLKIEYFA